MVDTIVDEKPLTAKDSRAFIDNSEHGGADNDCDAKNDKLRVAILRARRLIHELSSHVMRSPMEETKFPLANKHSEVTCYDHNSHLNETTQFKDRLPTKEDILNVSTPERAAIFPESIGISGHDIISDKDVLITVSSLVNALDDSLRQIQQLKFKNMLIESNSNNIQSTFEVEENLRKQQFERMKCQLLLDKQELIETLHFKEGKIAKYKNRIVEKNRLINKLMRTLNENSIHDNLKFGDFESSRKSSMSSANRSISKDKTYDMLKTLGLLASQVLNDEIDEDSNQTIQQPSEITGGDCNATEIDITSNSISRVEKDIQLPTIEFLADSKSVSGTPIEKSVLNDSSSPHIELPKMKNFSTVDGTVKDIN
ncbi:hypothetical protein HG535_0D01040 [Zygotorulaspora mrakii]|uniref:Uncharacterized protein n=1 Tax=Zygotorulaspora mrakii TaxID=42260 RepID=A0A7H9B1T6_ZYGMR|nr:uncharacterized protein HG535_0D01040 [Zygotorulaspora mrakii]QLG72396.1 hypothetical protein HG535_0D01040 [Zygotorulaspora mrakii]